MNIRGINDVYGVGELEATGSALIEAHEGGHDLGEWGAYHRRADALGQVSGVWSAGVDRSSARCGELACWR